MGAKWASIAAGVRIQIEQAAHAGEKAGGLVDGGGGNRHAQGVAVEPRFNPGVGADAPPIAVPRHRL